MYYDFYILLFGEKMNIMSGDSKVVVVYIEFFFYRQVDDMFGIGFDFWNDFYNVMLIFYNNDILDIVIDYVDNMNNV